MPRRGAHGSERSCAHGGRPRGRDLGDAPRLVRHGQRTERRPSGQAACSSILRTHQSLKTKFHWVAEAAALAVVDRAWMLRSEVHVAILADVGLVADALAASL